MNNGRIWTVVSPNVGVPVFFVALVVTSLYIHLQVMLQTDWFPAYYQGSDSKLAKVVPGDTNNPEVAAIKRD